jgi:hypothetical protein
MLIDRHEAKSNLPRRAALAAAALVLGACAHKGPPPEAAKPAGPPAAAPVSEALPPPPPIVEQAALDRLKAMSDKLAAAKAFTYKARSTVELPAKTGQFLTHFLESETALQRPDKLYAKVSGDVAGFQLYYDGASVAALDPQKNLYATLPAPATIDAMLPFLVEKTGIDFPSADFMYSNPYAEMTKDLTHAIVVGPAKVNGVPTEHFAFMGPAANWEIWIDTGESALPRRVAVTYKTVENFPRFQVEYLEWNLKPKLSPGQFVFKKPAGAKPIEFGAQTERPAR